MSCCFDILRKLTAIGNEAAELRSEVRGLRFLILRPAGIDLFSLGGNGMAIKFAVVLPEPSANPDDWDEIYYGKLIVSIEGKSPLEFTIEKSVQQTPDRLFQNEAFIGPQQAVVTLDYSYIDDAGNQGASVTAAIELQDTVPPVAPTAIGIVQTEEVPD